MFFNGLPSYEIDYLWCSFTCYSSVSLSLLFFDRLLRYEIVYLILFIGLLSCEFYDLPCSFYGFLKWVYFSCPFYGFLKCEFISHALFIGSSRVSLFLMSFYGFLKCEFISHVLFMGCSSVSLFLMSFHRLLKCEFFYVHITSIKYLINISNANSLMFLNVNNSGKYFLLKHM